MGMRRLKFNTGLLKTLSGSGHSQQSKNSVLSLTVSHLTIGFYHHNRKIMEKLYKRVSLLIFNIVLSTQAAGSNRPALFLSPKLVAIRLVEVLFLVSLLSLNGNAANKTFTGTGNFSNATRWGGSVPVAGDNLRINGNCTVDNNASTDNVAYGTLEIGRTSAGTLQWATSGTNRLNVSDVFSSVASSNLNMTNGGSLIIRGTWTSTNLTFTPGTGSVDIQSVLTLPTAYTSFNDLVLGNTVSIGAANFTNSGTLTVSGTLLIISTTGTKTFNNLVINSSATLDNSVVAEPITISGDLTNNGSFTSDGRVTFSGSTSNIISGTGTTAFNGGITVAKGSLSNILDVQSVITMQTGGLVLTSGVFKLTGASTITPFTADITTSPFLIPAAAGLWVNGGTISPRNMSWTFAGLLKVSAGTLNVGSANTNWLAPQTGATIEIEGGNLNAADRLSQVGASWNYIMTGGTLTVPYVSTSTADRPPFNMESSGCSFSMSGGTIIIERAGGSTGQNLGFFSIAGAGSGFTGGTLQIGSSNTPAASIIGINTTQAVYNLTVNSANVTAKLETGLTVSNNVTLTAGTLDVNNLNMSVGGSWSKASAAGFTPGTATVTFNGSGAQVINGTSASQTFNDLVVAKTSGTTLSTGGSTTTINTNNLTQTSGNFTAPATLNINAATASSLVLTAGTFTAGAALNITGNWTKASGATFTHSSGTVTFTGTGSQTINGTSASQTFYNVVIAKTAGTLLSTGGSTTTLSTNNLTLTTGNFTAPATMNINANLLLSAGTYTAATNTSVGGNWTKNSGSAFTHNSGTVTMNGNSAQTIGGSSSTTFYKLFIGNASGVVLGVNTTVANEIDLSSGSVTLSDYNLSMGTATISNSSSTHYFVTKENTTTGGFLVRNVGAAAKLFPVGSSSYTPVTVTNAGTADDFRVRVFSGVYTSGTSGGLHPDYLHSVNKTWLVEENVAGGSNVTLNVQWNQSDENSSFTRGNCALFHFTGGLWDMPPAFTTCSTVSPGVYSRSRSGFTSFSPFAIGDRLVPLPVELLSFTAKKVEKEVILNWSTATEINNSYFAIERSMDGENFMEIDQVAGAGNSNKIIAYSYTDRNVLTETTYYRLKQVDNDGNFSYSAKQSVQPSAEIMLGNIYPMPAMDNIFVPIETIKGGTYTVSISDLSGTVVYSEKFILPASSQTLNISTSDLNSGMYNLSIMNSNGENHSMKLVK